MTGKNAKIFYGDCQVAMAPRNDRNKAKWQIKM